MNEMTNPQGIKKQGWIMRLVIATAEKCFDWMCQNGAYMSPAASQEFFYYHGYGCEEAIMYHSLMRTKMVDEGI